MRTVWKYRAEARAEQQQQQQQHNNGAAAAQTGLHHPAVRALQSGKLGVCFSGAGFGAAYQLGAAQVLQAIGILGSHTPVSGASAGSIVAVATRCSLPQLDVLDALDAVAQDMLQNGESKRLRGSLQQQLQRLLPPNAYQLCSSNSTTRNSRAQYHILPQQQQQQQHHRGPSGTIPTPSTGTSDSAHSTSHSPQHPGRTAPMPMHAGVVSGSSSAAGSSSNPPCVLGATRVRPCCPGCVQPDVFVGGYGSNDELMEVLLSGAHIPCTSDGSLWSRYRGHHYVDAGLRDPCPPLPGVEYTVIVYPVSSQLFRRLWPYRLLSKPPLPEAVAISPGLYGRDWPYSRSYKQSNTLVMHPQQTGVLNMLFERGRRDALAWAYHIGLTPDTLQQLRATLRRCMPLAAAGSAQPAGPSYPSTSAAAGAPAGSSQPREAAEALLCTAVSELPMLVPVPRDLLHFL